METSVRGLLRFPYVWEEGNTGRKEAKQNEGID
jgi:hypothetical protein